MAFKMNLIKGSVITATLLNVVLSSSCASANNTSENDITTSTVIDNKVEHSQVVIADKTANSEQTIETKVVELAVIDATKKQQDTQKGSQSALAEIILIEPPVVGLPIAVPQDLDGTEQKASPVIESESKTELMAILSNINYFSANFTQKIFDESGEELQQGSGVLSVSKPNLVNWETQSPSESLIVSDGENLWFYDPFVEQVSVYSLENAIANTPILLITNNDPKLWQDYHVNKLTDTRYLIEAIDDNARVKSLELTFDSSTINSAENVHLAGFSILDATGQLSVIYLSEQSLQPSAANNETQRELFKFTVPEGVYLDDQR